MIKVKLKNPIEVKVQDIPPGNLFVKCDVVYLRGHKISISLYALKDKVETCHYHYFDNEFDGHKCRDLGKLEIEDTNENY